MAARRLMAIRLAEDSGRIDRNALYQVRRMDNVVNRRSSERHPSLLEDGRVVTDVDVINGCYKLSWRERIGFCSGDLAQNLIYQTVSIWLLFYYNNVYGLDSAVVAVMFLVVRIIDVVWDPMVGAIVDKSHPRWGKYRSWLISQD